MAHIQDQYSGLWKPQNLAVDKIISQKMFVDNTETLSAFILLQKTLMNQPVNSIIELRAINTSDTTLFPDKKLIFVPCCGWYYLDRDSALADNGTNIIAPTTGGGRWILQSASKGNYFIDTASTDSYAIVIPWATSYTDIIGIPLFIKCSTLNTTSCTIEMNSLGAKNLCRGVSVALVTGDIIAGQIIEVVYDGTQFQLKSQGANVVNMSNIASADSTFASAVRAVVITGLSVATNAAITATDTILAALGKLQAQITSLGSTKANLASPTFTGTVGGITASMVGLGNVSNVTQMPLAGGAFTGPAVAQSNTSYTTSQLRNVTLSTADASGGSNGDIWITYTP